MYFCASAFLDLIQVAAFVNPAFHIAAVAADIMIDGNTIENSHAHAQHTAGPVVTGKAVEPGDLLAAAFGTGSCVFHNSFLHDQTNSAFLPLA